jgi:hypothetical protein
MLMACCWLRKCSLTSLCRVTPPNRANSTARANSGLDKTWGKVTLDPLRISAQFTCNPKLQAEGRVRCFIFSAFSQALVASLR